MSLLTTVHGAIKSQVDTNVDRLCHFLFAHLSFSNLKFGFGFEQYYLLTNILQCDDSLTLS